MINKIGTFSQINSTHQMQEKNINTIQKEEKISRVEAIKEQIKNGTYEVNIEKTAKALAKALL